MYKLWRDIHLLLGLFLCGAILVLGVSSVIFAHRTWFDNEPTVTEHTVPVDPAGAGTPRALANQLVATQGYRGWLSRVRETDEDVRLVIGRMGTIHDVHYQRGAAEAHVKKRVWPFTAMLTWMHGMFKVDHEYALHNVWGWLMLTASVGLLVLGGSGIYLWWRLQSERRVGLALLGGNGLFLLMMALIWIA